MVYTYYYSTGRDLPKNLAWLCYLPRKFSRANILTLRATCVLPVRQYIGASRSKCWGRFVCLVVRPLVVPRGLPGEDLSVLNVVCPECPLVIPRGVPGEDLSVLNVVCPLVIPRGVPGEDLSVLWLSREGF